MITIKDEKDFSRYANSLNYRYAVTYTNFSPHEYVMIKEDNEELEIIRALNKYIQEHGVIEEFHGKDYQVLFIDKNKYWSMDEWSKTRILNRNWDFKEPDGTINRSVTESKMGS